MDGVNGGDLRFSKEYSDCMRIFKIRLLVLKFPKIKRHKIKFAFALRRLEDIEIGIEFDFDDLLPNLAASTNA